MNSPVLTRRPYHPPTGPGLIGDITLAPRRCHEFCGPSRFMLALWLARNIQGPIFWIKPKWSRENLMPDGVARVLNPGRITFVTPHRLPDILWSMEEILRSGEVPLTIAELAEPAPLTPIRRLHLAAEGAIGKISPLGVMLSPADGGCQGIETRWHMAPRHTRSRDSWLLTRRRARMAPPAAWDVTLERGMPQLAQAV